MKRVVTYFFRKQFYIDNPACVSQLNMGLNYLDGVVVYLNGQEVGRKNMGYRYNDYGNAANVAVNNGSFVSGVVLSAQIAFALIGLFGFV